ncbi:long-chain fatty acid--CoA ligase [Tessaracoccus sp. ZS01]|uniref:AMP-dependent synthetase/ligase n=1 Tax=Tessaracoccus sp. ZS01 TaxID=1906324 RepID=UPI00096D724B|nr:long-chain fatty acid--CoA ligase [Tessaracoccus sp. ZS01]MCG6567522.1 long-chain fatty acid--CoA ligase [Tessaracoccus sp. ZS01]OMG55888.1 long-chain fatty acid--CoA ligase [Tessaracoccus sp. ZS01]
MNHVVARVRSIIEQHGHRTATRIRENDAWRTQTYAQFGEQIRRVAQGLLNLGVETGGRVGIFLGNSPEWSEIDLGCGTVRAVPVPLYATSTPEQIQHIAGDSGLTVMFVGNQSEAERVLEVFDSLPELQHVIITQPYDGMPAQIVSYADFLAEPTPEVEERFAGADGDDLASIIYTSGTTGNPKGVMLQHKAFVMQSDALDQFFDITPDDHSLSFLPLSHALERAWTYVVLMHGCMNTYVENARTVAEQMVLAQPTMMASVPKLFETVYSTAHQKAGGSPVKRAIFAWALKVGRHNQYAFRAGREPGASLRAKLRIADKLVLGNVRAALGGPKTVLACGGAPLRPEIEEFFASVGLPVMQGYGLTEASPLVSFNAPDDFKENTTGKVLPGGQIRIGDFGEILYKGLNVMKGYWNDQEATDQVIKDGWLHTGDVGYVDTDGFLIITDRLKDIIVTLGGKNVAPQPIEGLILADPLFEHAVLLGDNRPFVTLLVKPSLPAVEELAKRFSWPGEMKDWMNSSELLDELRRRVDEITARLPSQERPKETTVLHEEFTMDNGLLTPTLKVRRREVEKRFRDLVDEMYARLERARKQG